MLGNKKIAIVYDWIDKWGGVERVLLTLHEMFPHAQFYTSYFDPETARWAKNISIKTSLIQKLPAIIKKNRILSLLIYPFAFESFNFSSYDLVISITSSFAKAIITKPSTRHICYLLTPTRYLWLYPEQYLSTPMIRIIGEKYINYLKKWDYVAAQRPDKIISISKTVAERCQQYYQRDSEVVYPPFNINYWRRIKEVILVSEQSERTQNQLISKLDSGPIKISEDFQGKQARMTLKNKKYFLVVSRLEPYKKVDMVVKAFNDLPDKELVVVGIGSLEGELKRMAHKNIRFISYVSDKELAQLYSNAEALIMPQEEDFGYVSLEAQFFGCPVIAFDKGGVQETVLPDKTGLFFSAQNPLALSRTLDQFHTISYNLKKRTQNFGRKSVERFNKKIFINNFLGAITL